jgi:hypothetical protein
MLRAIRIALTAVALAVSPSRGAAQQVPDRDFRPSVTAPRWPTAGGPRLCLDEAHHNFHTLDGRYAAFGALAASDGFRVLPHRVAFSAAALANCDLLVIANAQPSDAPWEQYPVPTPSAFSEAEIDATRLWVERGGALLLIADHMPLAGAAARLAATFGFTFLDGFATAPVRRADSVRATLDRPALFRTADSTLRPHAIIRGVSAEAAVLSVRTFTGQAFQAPPRAEPLLVVPADWIMLLPTRAWQFSESTPTVAVGGWLQGATLSVGAGRVAVFGEAAMFSAQRAGPERRPMGFNAPGAERNAQFALNTLHWLVAR